MLNTTTPIHTLIVEDDQVILLSLKAQIEKLGHTVETATNGEEGLKKMRVDAPDIVLLDKEMPGMNGIEVVHEMKQDNTLKHIPVIMETAADDSDEIKEGIDAGVFYYLVKPIEPKLLISTIESAIKQVNQRKTLASELKQHKRSFAHLKQATFQFQYIEEAESLAYFIANCYPDPERVVSGLAELFINALEHGNLCMGYEAKSDLVKNSNWREEIIRRSFLPENTDKTVDVTLDVTEDKITLVVKDQGEGFNWQKFTTIDPARAMKNHGRGIAQANAISFDELHYNKKGNEVTAIVNLTETEEIEW